MDLQVLVDFDRWRSRGEEGQEGPFQERKEHKQREGHWGGGGGEEIVLFGQGAGPQESGGRESRKEGWGYS